MSDELFNGAAQRALARLYERLGARIVYVVYATNIVIGLLTGLVALIWVSRYLDLPTARVAVIAALIVLGGAPGGAFVLWAWRDLFATTLSWAGSNRSAERAPVVWSALVRLPYAVTRRAVVAASLLMALFTVLVFAFGIDRSWYGAIPFYASTLSAVLAAGVLWTFGAEFAMRPMLRDVAARLPADFEPPASAWRLHVKSLAPLPVVTLFAALTTGAFIDAVPAGASRLALALGIAGVTVLVAGVVFLIVTRSTLDPIDDLLDATRRVRSGDISTPVPIVTNDDFGRLGHNFNEMLAELRRHREELRASQVRIVTAADAARRNVERDLHDGAQQRMVMLRLKLGLATEALISDPSTAMDLIEEMRADITQALIELRELARGLYPALLENDGLAAALGEAVRRSPIPATLECDELARLPAELEAAVYFCCLEALSNAAKHAGEDAVTRVTLTDGEGVLTFEVNDDGVGFERNGTPDSGGLQNMIDRIGALGGQLQIASAPGAGTTVTGTLPIKRYG